MQIQTIFSHINTHTHKYIYIQRCEYRTPYLFSTPCACALCSSSFRLCQFITPHPPLIYSLCYNLSFEHTNGSRRFSVMIMASSENHRKIIRTNKKKIGPHKVMNQRNMSKDFGTHKWTNKFRPSECESASLIYNHCHNCVHFDLEIQACLH